MVLSIFGLVNVETIMNHLRNETMESYTTEALNETHFSIFRRNRGEMTAEDAKIIERGEPFESFRLIQKVFIPLFSFISSRL